MNKTYLAVEQIGSLIGRHHKQRATLIGIARNSGRALNRRVELMAP